MNKATMFYVVLLFFETKSNINPYGPTIVNDFERCVVNIMENSFKKSGLIIFADTNNVSVPVTKIRLKLLKYIHKDVKYAVQVTSPINKVPICDDFNNHTLGAMHMDQYEAVPLADYFIIIIDEYKDFTLLASKIVRSRNWNPRAKFVILFFKFAKSNVYINYVERMLTCLFSFNVINIVVIVPEENHIRNAIIFSWRPYVPPKYCGYLNETAKNRLIVENICTKGNLKNKKPIFQNKLPANMSGCALHILALNKQPFISGNDDDPNIEKLLISEVLKLFEIEVKFEVITNYFRGERYDGEWDGGLKLLTARRGDILLGGIFPDFDVHEDFDASTWYLADVYTWVVPRAYSSPPWIALFICFENTVWFCVCITFVICGFVWVILGHLGNDFNYNKNLGHCFLNTWICILGFSSYIRPKRENLRVFFVFFNLYCILNLTAYQTKLIDVLRNPTFEYQIKTVEELIDSDLKYGGSEELHGLFINSTDKFDNFIGEQWTDVDDLEAAMIDVVIHRNFSVLCSRLELDHVSAIMPELSDSYGNYKYYAFKMNMFTVPLEMTALRGFPFMTAFSETLSAFRQNGITTAVRRRFTTVNTKRRENLLRSLERKQSNYDGLTIQHLQGGFLALMLGYIGGTLTLFAEITWYSNFVQHKVSVWKNKVKNKLL